MSILASKAFKYATHMEIGIRAKNLFSSGFSYIAFFLAQIYCATGLLPRTHPYLVPGNIGRYGIQHVLGESIRLMTFNRKNIDRIIIFGLLLIGVFILFSQFTLLALSIFVQAANAADIPNSIQGFFEISDEQAKQELAFILLDRVFGIPDMFNSCIAVTAADAINYDEFTELCHKYNDGTAFPNNFHMAMHHMFQIYSVGLLVIAVLILCYFVFTILAETAQSGTPFGRRFNHVWAPLRLVAAIGLLIPISNGLNSAQYITLHVAKWGSNFATNGWHLFIDTAVETPQGTLLAMEDESSTASSSSGGDACLEASRERYSQLVACPNPPPLNAFMEFFSAVATCVKGNEHFASTESERSDEIREIEAYIVKPGVADMSNGSKKLSELSSFDAAYDWLKGESDEGPSVMKIYIGHKEDTAGSETREVTDIDYPGGVTPHCGILRFDIPDGDEEGSPGSWAIMRGYYRIIRSGWSNTTGFDGCNSTSTGYGDAPFGTIGSCMIAKYVVNAASSDSASINIEASSLIFERENYYQKPLINAIIDGLEAQGGDNPRWKTELKELGWVGAAIWYNKIAQMNGTLIAAAHNMPIAEQYPLLMEEVLRLRLQEDDSIAGLNRYNPRLSDDQQVDLTETNDIQLATAMYHSQKLWFDIYTDTRSTGNIFIDIVNFIFGTDGLFNMRTNIERGVHPLAVLTGIGRSLIESSLRNMGVSFGAGLLGGISNVVGAQRVGTVLDTASSFAMTLGTLGLTIGFVLFYVIPFMPFIYFFFAAGGWVKGLFEAMVGVPLWALAHIRIDGQGLPGDAAMNGYYLLLEIFLRPILIVFGLLAGIVIFSAQMTVLNEIWPLVVSNVGGFDRADSYNAGTEGVGSIRYIRGAVDSFFYTLVYAIIGYMLALASFKLIDLIPNHIMRWMGANVSTFGEQSGDAAQGLVRNTFFGGQMVGGGLQQVSQGTSETLGALTGRNNTDPNADDQAQGR